MASGLLKDYIGRGLAAARPVTPTPGTGVAVFYYATDTSVLSVWDGSAWDTITGGGGGGGSAVGARRFWRLISRGKEGASLCGWSGIDLRAVASGANVATGGTLISFIPQQAIGGTVFGGNGTGTDFIQFTDNEGNFSWVGYDMGVGNSTAVLEIGIFPLFADVNRTPNNFAIQCSDDGVIWRNVCDYYVTRTGYTYNTRRILPVPSAFF